MVAARTRVDGEVLVVDAECNVAVDPVVAVVAVGVGVVGDDVFDDT